MASAADDAREEPKVQSFSLIREIFFGCFRGHTEKIRAIAVPYV
jgi:hypothetical protein